MQFDVVVVGGGHAGCEAAAAAARCGAQVALITSDPRTIGVMSCNPAIGGVGKGHLVREIDVFDGLMARAADDAAIHYRLLNRSKGAAVHGPRVQADRRRYRAAIQRMIAAQPRLTVIAGEAARLVRCGGRIDAIETAAGAHIATRAVVLATGTFLGGRLHEGERQLPGGRVGEAASLTLAAQMRELALPMGRLKTGTPPRLDGRTIDWARLDRQASDRDGWTFSPLSVGRKAPQLACAVTRTNRRTHDIIRDGLDRSPLHTGAIQGSGPRYCPSIEDKVVRFGDRDGHQIFLEPEGLDDPTIYPNGISTSLPIDMQRAIIRSIAGLEQARIVQPGYAVEYDHIDPRVLDMRLALRAIDGIFCAGQINGTTGYEEAAAQGLVAGLNAAALALDREPIRFDRTDSYIGVMIDDLTLQGITEPYRMLTARAEYRLHIRADNAASRLADLARRSGAIGHARSAWLDHQDALRDKARPLFQHVHNGATIADHVRRASVTGADIVAMEPALADAAEVIPELLEDIRYAPYVTRQRAEVEQLRRDDHVRLDNVGPYGAIHGLSGEMIERLEAARPETLGAARRVRGVTPAALTAIMMAMRRRAA